MSPKRRFTDRENNIYPFRYDENYEIDLNNAELNKSGNSDVDVYVNVEIDTKPIAHAILCTLLATKKISKKEFEEALIILEEITKNHKNRIPGLRLFGPLSKNDSI
ncbi:hypothetical protein M4D71_15485 [Niallia taxi]|uniref:hypothetical protein n=1 Tax=Niallia taxi TaxID=2499688 RepID=UPI0021A63956|nr:hypothetical protein [Niallia taxi]MCT2345559.1 hypothetical protein [Niallia taxi]